MSEDNFLDGIDVTSVRRHHLAACEKCPLNDPRNAYVPSQFPTTGTAAVAVVGEAPGFQEAAYHRPFMGPSGQLIKKVLKNQGFDTRHEVLYTNVCLCRPPDNATPPATAIAACRPRLLHELDDSGVQDVVALGGTATSALLDDSRNISTLRVGPPKSPTRSLAGSAVKRVLPTWHPAYCLRNADAFPALVSDLFKLKDRHSEPWSEPHITIVDNLDSALRAIEELHVRTNTLVVDIEVGVDKDVSFFHPNEFDLLCVGLAYAKRRAVVIGEGALAFGEVRDALRTLLQRKKLVAHNGKFDLAGLQPLFGMLELWFDTMLASYVLDERPGQHGLKVLAVEKLGAPKYDDEIKQYIPKGDKNYANIPRPILYKYNAYDVACTWDLYEMFSRRLATPVAYWPYAEEQFPVRTLRDVHDMLVAASNQLMYIELNGITADLPYNFQLGDEFEQRLEVIEGELAEIVSGGTAGAVESINPRSPKQVKEFLQTQHINVDSTNVETLTRLQSKVSPNSYAGQFVSTLLKHRREQKLYSTYVIGLRKRIYRGRVYTTYLLHGTTSGRLASRNPNLQNIVRDKAIRRQFSVAKPDHVLIQADYKQAELRVMATLAQEPFLMNLFKDPEADLFTELVTQIYGVSRDEALNGSAKSKEMRIRIKAFVYGLGYGREYASIAKEYGLTLPAAYKLSRDFFDLIPNVEKWQKEIKKTVHERQELITPFGRRRRFHLITDQNRRDVENEALSFLPQSTASDICLRAFTNVRPLLRGLAFVRLTIHDALTVECHRDRADEVGAILTQSMVQSGREFTDYVPFWTDLSVGTTWGDL